MKKKIKSKSGETLVETIFAMLVVVLACTMLAGSIVSAAKVNKGAKDLTPAFEWKNAKDIGEKNLIITHVDGSTSVVKVKAYQTDDDNEYCYYEYKAE